MPMQLTSGFSAKSGRDIRKLFKEAKALYAPEGEFMAGTEAGIARGSKRAVASGVQQLASAGLAGTSMVGGLGKKYEEEIGMPARQQATTARLQALAGLLQAEAGAELQMAPRYGYQAPTPSYGGGGQATAPRTTAQPRAAAQPRTTTAQPQQPQQQLPLPPLNLSKKFAPAGQWQGTIGGTSFYSTGTGGMQQKEAPAPRKPLSSFYGDLMKSSPKQPSLTKQLDPYGTFMNF